jgi:hypothetical protein
MSDLMPRPRDAMRSLRSVDPLAPTLPYKVRRAIDRESSWGLVSAARAQAAGFATEARVDSVAMVTEHAMISLDRLHKVEASFSRQDPVKAERFNALVEDFLTIARCELRNLPREF